MLDQMFESARKASESSFQMQQDAFKAWSQQWFAAPPNVAGTSGEWGRNLQKRGLELVIDLLQRHREAIDSLYRTGISVFEQTQRLSEAKSGDEYRRLTEEIWRKAFDAVKEQSETQFRELQKIAERSFQAVQNPRSAT
jgi:hypothetical protein